VDERDDIQQKMNDAIWSVASEDITSWDVLGLLHYGITRENSISTLRVFGEAMEEDEEDE
jgi:hypothetical protein